MAPKTKAQLEEELKECRKQLDALQNVVNKMNKTLPIIYRLKLQQWLKEIKDVKQQ